MAYISLPLYSSPFYSYTISLQNNNYEITFLWNERSKAWYFDLAKEDGTFIVEGQKVVTNYPILLSYSIPNLTGYFWLEPYSDKTQYSEDIAREIYNHYFLSYIY